MKKLVLGLIFGALLVGNINAQEKTKDEKKWQARFRWVSVMPNESATIGTIGGDVEISNSFIPELDFTYFFTENIAAELILGTAKHNVNAVGTALGNVDLGHVWLLPPTLTVQYHFNLNNFRPYVGAGGNYTIFYSANPGAVVDVSYKNSFGYAFQAGFDYDLDDTWFLNVDAKYIGLSTDVTVNAGVATVPADVDINPLLIGFGIGMKF
ncbi:MULTISPECIES: OmpW/AlkL family protein [unclassified Tenacibaculum]|uniref:OmpW/AlkL family protein n=1 Tax=unclassified Tenacibaculum TaxID=2635139 RepID=UPI001F181EC2|nr:MULTISPECIES: OmpW family outer membrane protein [unclassified Tenacibaculum]MCF2875825.1 outer membrane beta-barrel protein [Tenacibaculum sp. Cn5-1]MCF2935900.1 outer membrane beta-barrel protein [Tenacibaculum sp. Cn5-34]MCG7512461.1 outer membrane beta-barrel protein [Tenacibaculum sp. Cn5-46]